MMVAIRRAIRSSKRINPIGRGAIRDGQLAQCAFHESACLFRLAEDQERSIKAEKTKQKMQKDWWRSGPKGSGPKRKIS